MKKIDDWGSEDNYVRSGVFDERLCRKFHSSKHCDKLRLALEREEASEEFPANFEDWGEEEDFDIKRKPDEKVN
jgi:hypothetical protein